VSKRGANRKEPAPPDPALLAAALAVPVDDGLLRRALTHRSYAYEHGGLPTNERLEFLGDAVLGLVVTDALYRGHPDLPEGQLAKLRASVVNMRALASVARTIGESGIGPWIRLGRGEETTGGREKLSILADTLEALIGAVYESSGIEVASMLVRRLFDPLIESSTQQGAGLDWKTALQELLSTRLIGPPEYVVEESGPDHAKRFRATLLVAGDALGTGEGGSKKEAEQRAAAEAVAALAPSNGAASNGAAGNGAASSGAASNGESGARAGSAGSGTTTGS
jgi:ribonuclease-3